MNHRQLFADSRLKQEFLDRFPAMAEFAPVAAPGGFEGLDDIDAKPSIDDAKKKLDDMGEPGFHPVGDGLEAIIERFTRPVYLVQDGSFIVPPDPFPNSTHIADTLSSAKHALDSAIASVGRIDLTNHRHAWVGTAWMIAQGIAVTNRHVAEEFSRSAGDAFVFRTSIDGRLTKAKIDWRREHYRAHESVFDVTRVLWIEPEPSHDVALLEVASANGEGHPLPQVLELMTDAELEATKLQNPWVAVIGYPARDSRNRADDQQRIFDGIYNVKRLPPGQRTTLKPEGVLMHDATTLGGNSGSAIVDLTSGKVMALHYGGYEGEANYAVRASCVAEILKRHAA